MSNIMNSKAFSEARRKAEEKVKELNLTEKIEDQQGAKGSRRSFKTST